MSEKLFQDPLVNTKGKEIIQIGIIVEDAAKTAIEMGGLFGLGPWTIVHAMPTELIFHDNYVGTAPYAQRLAQAELEGLQIELIQPLYGQGSHTEFLQKHGQGIQHVSFGHIDDYDDMLGALKKAGFCIEFQGLLAGFGHATYMDMVEDLGTVLEFTKSVPSGPPGEQTGIVPIGKYAPLGPAAVNMAGKKIVKLGIVVGDAEKTAKRYWEILGVGPWTFTDMVATEVVLHGRELGNTPFSLRSGVAKFGDLHIELLQPLSGPSSHMEFFEMHGNGIHHLSFGHVEDADEMLAALQKEGYEIEMQGIMGDATQFFYMSTQKKLGAIFEFDKQLSGKTSTLTPYSTYPSSK